ncbi:hypothetical protein [Blastococcus sp. Marseille-P5729]|uniref:hypothetical protein n=1 Tax=Blastococcus sp. Marseille-P5729 TaxID=2086582 RepID=UPI000D0E5D67|nr:hypothetical protein [Blastococcus sp. Marseille-P5729]
MIDDPGLLGEVLQAAIAYIPAIAVLVGVAGLLAGWLPRCAGRRMNLSPDAPRLAHPGTTARG